MPPGTLELPTLDRPRDVASEVDLTTSGLIVGKAIREHFRFSGGPHTSNSGPFDNPHRESCSAGGLSSSRDTLGAVRSHGSTSGDRGG